MKILFISNLFPDQQEPVRGLDNATLLHELGNIAENEVRVLAPRPDLVSRLKGKESHRSPRPEDRQFDPKYPPVAYIPRFGSYWNDGLMKNGLRTSLSSIADEWKPDVVLGSWLFPDGCALAKLCDEKHIPLVLITQGSDTHQYLTSKVRRQKILDAIDSAQAVICRSGDLAKRLLAAGAPRNKLEVIYNGIDPKIFFPIARNVARKKLGEPAEEPLLLFVGNLLPVKNPIFLLQAHAELNRRRKKRNLSLARLQVIGEGPMKKALKREAMRLHIKNQVEFLGRREPTEIALRMNAADVFCLSSRNEGFPNVLLEALACNLPIVSTDVGGIEEKLANTSENRLVEAEDLSSYVTALEEILGVHPRSRNAQPGLNWQDAAGLYQECLSKASAIERY